MARIRELWSDFAEKYQPRIVKLLLVIALGASILFNVNAIPTNEGWLLSLILFSILLFSAQLDSVYQKSLHPKLRVYQNHNSQYSDDMHAAISQNQSTKADLLEFSTYSIHTTLLQELATKHYSIRLLVSHPESTPNLYQRQTVEKYLKELLLMRDQYSNQQDFQVKCYQQNASFRGRKIGDQLISVSWFTYGTQRVERSNMPEHIKQSRRPQDLEGHTNVLINANLSTPEGKILESMFDRVFQDLWVTGLPLDDVAAKLGLA